MTACKYKNFALSQSLLYVSTTLYTKAQTTSSADSNVFARVSKEVSSGAPMGISVLSDDNCMGRLYHHAPCQDGAEKGMGVALHTH